MAIEELDLRDAAKQLGVHYQTAYKWVRSGLLEAYMVDGQYRLRQDEVTAYGLARSEPVTPGKPRSSHRNHDRLQQRLLNHLLEGEETKARKMVAELATADGLTHTTQALLAPVLRTIGDEWHAGRLSIGHEHRASAIIERILGELHPMPRGRRRGTVVVASLTGDRHVLPTIMAANALREDNWRVDHLGADMPGDEVLRFCRDRGNDLAVLTVLMHEVMDLADDVAAQLRALGVRTLIGRPGDSLFALQELARDNTAGLVPGSEHS